MEPVKGYQMEIEIFLKNEQLFNHNFRYKIDFNFFKMFKLAVLYEKYILIYYFKINAYKSYVLVKTYYGLKMSILICGL